MYNLYIDEFGDSSVLLGPGSGGRNDAQPFVILSGVIIKSELVPTVTDEVIRLKKRYFPNALPANNGHNLTWLQVEIKGANLKKGIVHRDRNRRRTFSRFYRDLFHIINNHDIKLLTKCYVKPFNQLINFENIYTSCVQNFCSHFQHFLNSRTSQAYGSVILDSRQHHKDKRVAFSIATQKYKMTSDKYPNLIEVPSFGMDNNHIGLQICDWLVSGVVVPVCGLVYINPHLPNNIFANSNYIHIKNKYSDLIKNIQYRYRDSNHYRRGGLVVSDPNGGLNSSHFFR